jgi:hypothetical protein
VWLGELLFFSGRDRYLHVNNFACQLQSYVGPIARGVGMSGNGQPELCHVSEAQPSSCTTCAMEMRCAWKSVKITSHIEIKAMKRSSADQLSLQFIDERGDLRYFDRGYVA